jgi:hypothetical protein
MKSHVIRGPFNRAQTVSPSDMSRVTIQSQLPQNDETKHERDMLLWISLAYIAIECPSLYLPFAVNYYGKYASTSIWIL